MVEMLNNINEHQYKNNIDICYKLCTYIINNHIKDEKMLKSIEDGYFNTENISDELKSRIINKASKYKQDISNYVYDIEVSLLGVS